MLYLRSPEASSSEAVRTRAEVLLAILGLMRTPIVPTVIISPMK